MTFGSIPTGRGIILLNYLSTFILKYNFIERYISMFGGLLQVKLAASL